MVGLETIFSIILMRFLFPTQGLTISGVILVSNEILLSSTFCNFSTSESDVCSMREGNVNGTYLEWEDSVCHLGNYIDIACTDMIDCKAKRSVYRIC